MTADSEQDAEAETGEPSDPADDPALEALIVEAFRVAAQRGSPVWFQMHGTVLKNRLLDLTDRRFSESKYGVERFGELLDRLDKLLAIDHSIHPYVVVLREPYRARVAPSNLAPSLKIRQDLWRATVDYSASGKWVWEKSSRQAVLVETDIDDDVLLMPTLDPEVLGAWRSDFLAENASQLDEAGRLQAEAWSSKSLSTSALPPQLRNAWNDRVRKGIYERLVGFFEDHELEAPSDLSLEAAQPKPNVGLREYLRRCIDLMDEAELKQLLIPAHIAHRARR